MKYNLKGTYKRHFELFDDRDTYLGKLDYPSWFSIKANIILPSGEEVEIAPTSMWQTKVEFRSGERLIGSLKFNWKGQIVIQMENGPGYIFKRVGFFNFHYGLFNENEHELVAMKQHFKLSEFSFSYTAETDDNYAEGKDALLLLIMAYCGNYMHAAASAAM